jgi:hypothetical protein
VRPMDSTVLKRLLCGIAGFPIVTHERPMTVAAVGLLAAHLTSENHQGVLAAARHKRKQEVEQQVAGLRPQPAVPASARKLPAERTPEVART